MLGPGVSWSPGRPGAPRSLEGAAECGCWARPYHVLPRAADTIGTACLESFQDAIDAPNSQRDSGHSYAHSFCLGLRAGVLPVWVFPESAFMSTPHLAESYAPDRMWLHFTTVLPDRGQFWALGTGGNVWKHFWL